MDVVIGRRQRRDQVLGRRAMSSFQKKSGRRREPPTLRDERARERTTGSGIAARTSAPGIARLGAIPHDRVDVSGFARLNPCSRRPELAKYSTPIRRVEYRLFPAM